VRQLEEMLSAQRETQSGSIIQTIANYIQEYVTHQWRRVLEENQEELLRLYDEAGEPAYGVYAQKLFRPVREQLERAGFLSTPGFPGTLSTSLEWGSDEERERRMWCVMRQATEAPVGTIVVGLFHDHTRFRLPHPPSVLALEETDTDEIIRAISRDAEHQDEEL